MMNIDWSDARFGTKVGFGGDAMKVFVTGATGLIGAGVVRAMVAAGHEVTGLTRRAAGRAAIERAGARAVVGDMRDPEAYRAAVSEAEAVVHTAAAFPDKIRWSKADVDTFMRGDADAVGRGHASAGWLAHDAPHCGRLAYRSACTFPKSRFHFAGILG